MNLATASKAKVIEQGRITSNLIKERIRRDKMEVLEQWHREESSGSRKERIEQEQTEQEPISSESEPETDLDDFIGDSELPRNIIEPAIQLTVEALNDIEGDPDQSPSIFDPLQDLDGNDDAYPCLLYTSPSPRD